MKYIRNIAAAWLLAASATLVPVAAQQKTHVNVVTTQQTAEKVAQIQFDTLTQDLGTFAETDVVKCSFRFTNVGTAPLIIQQAIASCGCTIPTYTKDPVHPGESGTIEVTYNGKGKFGGPFKKVITIRSNAADLPLVRLTIVGDMQKAE